MTRLAWGNETIRHAWNARWIAASLVLLVGCEVYDASLLAGRDAAPASCTLMRPPPRPDVADGDADVGEVAWALRDVLFEQDGDRWRTIGYDLDDRCTASPDFDAECLPPQSSVRPEVDGEGGTDNAFGHQLYPLVAITVPGLQEASRESQDVGNGAILVRLNGWSGESNDPRVDVVVTVTVFGTPAARGGGVPAIEITPDGPRTSAGEEPRPPAWEGADYFWGRADNFVGELVTRPRLRDNNAYIADGELVARLPDGADFTFHGTDVGILARLNGGVLTGKISTDQQKLEDVQVAGRWPLVDLIRTAESVGVCPDTDLYSTFTMQLDRIADIRATPGSGSAGAECDAVSMGIVLDGTRAHFGGVAPGPPLANGCTAPPDAGTPDAGTSDAGTSDAGTADAGI